jgi:hypothetical protein
MGSKGSVDEFDLDIRLGEGYAHTSDRMPSDFAGFTGRYCTCVSVTCHC